MPGRSPYHEIKRKAVLDILGKFPDAGSHTLAKILKRDNPELFKDVEDARGLLRIYRGTSGKKNREEVKFNQYYRNAMA